MSFLSLLHYLTLQIHHKQKSAIPHQLSQNTLLSLSPHQPFQTRTIPRKSPTPLPPLPKGAGLTARHKLSLCCIFTCDTSAFFIHQTFCRQDGGIAFLPHPFCFSDTSVNNPSIVGSASHCNRSSPLHKGAKGDSALPTIPKPHYPSKIANTLASLVKGRWIDGKAQTVALLHFYLRYIRLFYSPNFLPSRRRDCFTPTNLSIPTTFSKAHPSPRLAPSLPQPHLSFSRYSSSNILFLPVYP